MKSSFLGILLFLTFQVEAKVSNLFESKCLSTREYITSLEYLREKEEFKVKESDARELAKVIAGGCTGAAGRFVSITDMLVRAGVQSAKAIRLGKDFSLLNQKKADSFLIFFKKLFLKKYFDLNVSDALRISLDLSEMVKGEGFVEKDFEIISSFCLKKDSLNLPYLKCASLAADVAKLGAKNEESIADKFIELYHFLRGPDTVNLNVLKSIDVAKDIAFFGKVGIENFVLAYKYSKSSKGLDLGSGKSFAFAMEMVKKTKVER